MTRGKPRHLFVGHVGHAMPGSNSEFQIGSLDSWTVFSGGFHVVLGVATFANVWVDVSDFCGIRSWSAVVACTTPTFRSGRMPHGQAGLVKNHDGMQILVQ